MAPAYPMDFGAYLSSPQNHKPMPSSQLTYKKTFAQWLHAAAFSPSISTFLNSVGCNLFTTWLNLTPQVIHRHLCTPIATVKGHLDQQLQQQQKHNVNEPPPSPLPTKSHSIYAAIIDPHQSTGSSYSDLTGRFPIQSNHGTNYIFILYEYDSNSILVHLLCHCSTHEIKCIFTSLYDHLVNQVLQPQLHMLNNEASTTLKDFLTTENIEYQLVPPHIH